MKIFARICSTIFHPLIIPTVGIFISLFFSYMSLLGDQYILTYTLLVALFTILFPCIGVLMLYKMKLITSVGLVNREERTLPYIIFLVCYVACAVYLWLAGLRGIQFGFVVGGIVALICDLIINRWWKISVHMTAIGGMTGLVFIMSILLKRHTLGQVISGFANGFIWICISCYIFLLITLI